jgi:hypothetical protein
MPDANRRPCRDPLGSEAVDSSADLVDRRKSCVGDRSM